jgi:hypothetical protein
VRLSPQHLPFPAERQDWLSRESVVEPPLIRGKRMADGKPKPRMECFFETVAFGTSGLAERWPISKLKVDIRGVSVCSVWLTF